MRPPTPVIARCPSGHEWPTTRTEQWVVIPPKRNVKTLVVSLADANCPKCGASHTTFTETLHLAATALVPPPPPADAPHFVRARCELGHQWQSTKTSPTTLADPYCPDCLRRAASFTDLSHG